MIYLHRNFGNKYWKSIYELISKSKYKNNKLRFTWQDGINTSDGASKQVEKINSLHAAFTPAVKLEQKWGDSNCSDDSNLL